MEIFSPESHSEFQQYFNLRWRILRKPWNQPQGSERDETDKRSTDCCYHLMATENSIVCAVARLELATKNLSQLRYMAVVDAYQNRGIGGKIIKHLEDYARNKNSIELFLNARENAVGFYQSQGYRITEKSYILFDSIQHFKMIKRL